MLALAALIWTLAVIAVSLMPIDLRVVSGTEPDHRVQGVPVYIKPPRHRLAHFVMFGVAAVMYLGLARRSREALWAAVGALALGIGIELAQVPIFGLRELEWWDIRDDAIGVAIAVAGWWAWKRLRGHARAVEGV